MNDYLCANWQGLLQMVVYLVARGYYYHMVVAYPEKKRGKWLEIDKKMIATYKCAKSKYQRARMKKRGEARLMFLRWESVAVVLHTDGALSEEMSRAGFVDIRERYAKILVSEAVAFFVYIDRSRRQATARLTRESYLWLKEEIGETCLKGRVYEIRSIVERLNGFPSWHGVVVQKVDLAKFAVKRARENHKRLSYRDLKIGTKRKACKVFSE